MKKRRPISNKELWALKKFIFRELGVSPSIRTTNTGEAWGWHDAVKDLITVSTYMTRDSYIHTVFHEAMHSYCYKNGIFKTYHLGVPHTTEGIANYHKNALRAEHYVNGRAIKLHKLYDPSIDEKAYMFQFGDAWFKEWVRSKRNSMEKEWL